MQFRVHGVVVETSLELDAAAEPDAGARPELTVERCDAPPPEVRGPVVCETAVPAGSYVGRQDGDDWSLRLEGHFAFRMNARSGRLLAWSAAEDEKVIATLVTGNVLAFWLQLRGNAMFHASAVVMPAGAVAVAGSQGSGKTTLAAHLCAGGGRLLTDDALRVDDDGNELICHPGSRMLRLRGDAERMAGELASDLSHRTWDERLAVRPPSAEFPQRLAAVVLPRHAAAADGVVVERLSQMQAAIELMGQPRWFGWRIDGPPRVHFRTATAIAMRVPVFALHLPLEAVQPGSDLSARVLEAVT